jgi:hypothetical protein
VTSSPPCFLFVELGCCFVRMCNSLKLWPDILTCFLSEFCEPKIECMLFK